MFEPVEPREYFFHRMSPYIFFHFLYTGPSRPTRKEEVRTHIQDLLIHFPFISSSIVPQEREEMKLMENVFLRSCMPGLFCYRNCLSSSWFGSLGMTIRHSWAYFSLSFRPAGQHMKERKREGKVLRVLLSGRWLPRNQGWLNFWETRLVTEKKSLPRSCWTELTCQGILLP